MRKYRHIALLCALWVAGCEGESGELEFSIYADPARTHAPGDVHFELTRDDGEPVETCTGSWVFGDGIEMRGDYMADHRYRKAGVYEMSVELTCDDQIGHATTQIEVYDTVDLAVGALEARPLDVSTDGSMTVGFQVSNEALEGLKVPTTVDIYLTSTASATAYLEAGSVRLYRHQISSLPGAGQEGAVTKVEVEVPMDASIRTGSYYVSAVINADGKIGETSRDNNVAYTSESLTVRNQVTDGADFGATRLQISPGTTSTLSAVTAQFEIMNLGATTAETFQYEIWLGAKDNAVDMEGAVKVHESTIDGGMSGVEQSFRDVMISIAPMISDPGLYYFWLVLDSTDKIVERDESNNVVRSVSPVQVTNEPVLDADIMVQSVVFTPVSTTPGGTFTAKMSLYNQGAQPTGSFVCTVYLSEDMSLDFADDHLVGSANIDDLLPTSSREVSAIVESDTGVLPGEYWVYVFCDSSGVVAEANEENNIQRSETRLEVVSTASIDLLLGQLQSESGTSLEDGADLRLSALLCNKGKTASGPSFIGVTRHNMCDGSKDEFARISVAGLEPDACEVFYAQAPMACDFWCPNYRFSFEADTTLIVAETNENNNVAVMPDSITMVGDMCACIGDAYEVNNAVSQGKRVTALDADLTLCPNDQDYFLIDMTEGSSFDVHLNHDSVRSPLQMHLLRGPDIVASSFGGDDLYLSGIQVKNTSELPVFLHVTGMTDDDANRYHLTLNTYSRTAGVDLMAADLAIDGGALNASDSKAVSVNVANIGSLASSQVWIGYYLSQSANIDASAWRIARQVLDPMAPGENIVKTIHLKLPADIAGGQYHLIAKIDDDDSLSDVRSQNNIARSSAWYFERSCWDILDPNESLDTARPLLFNNGKIHYDVLSVCQGNRDFYAIDVKDGTSLDISVEGLTTGDFDIVLYDAKGNEIASSRTGATKETIHRDLIVGDQTVYLEVFLLENIYNADAIEYKLDIETAGAPAWQSCHSAFEPNDFYSSAWDLRSAAQSGQMAALCPSTDQDYYVIDMVAGDRLQLGFETESTILRAALYATETQQFVAMLTNLTSQTFDYTAVMDGPHTLRVFTNVPNAESQAYRLLWTGLEGIDLAVSGLQIAPETLTAGMPVTIDFDISNAGTLDAIYSAEVVLEQNGRKTPLLTQISETALTPGQKKHIREKTVLPDYAIGSAVIRVQAVTTGDVALGNNVAQRVVSIHSGCQNDAAEPNDNLLLATVLTLQTSQTRQICPGDEDWYVISLTTAATAQISFDHVKSDLSLTAYDASGLEIAHADTANDVESLSLDAAEKIYLRVKGANSSVLGSYEISVQ